MRKLLSCLLFICFVHACSTVYYGDSKAPEPVRISDNYSPKNAKNDIRKKLLMNSERLIGTKYKYGGTTPKGFDCSGFTGYVYDKINIDISRSSLDQAKMGKKIKLKEAQSGDLVFFTGTGRNKISHVAMVVSNDFNGLVVIHSTTSKGVRKDNITHSKYWKPKTLFARRILD